MCLPPTDPTHISEDLSEKDLTGEEDLSGDLIGEEDLTEREDLTGNLIGKEDLTGSIAEARRFPAPAVGSA